jgi:hypothetical protein
VLTTAGKPLRGRQIDRTHPLSAGLRWAFPFNDRVTQTFRDSARGDLMTYTRLNPDTHWEAGRFKMGADGGGATLVPVQTTGLGATSVSIGAKWALTGSNPGIEPGLSTNHAFFGRYNGGSDIGVHLGYDATSGTVRYYVNSNGLALGASVSYIATYGGTWTVYVFDKNGVVSGTNNYNLAGSFGGTFTDTFGQVFQGNGSTSDKYAYWFFLWKRALKRAEVYSFAYRPFQMYRGPRFAAAGGGATTQQADLTVSATLSTGPSALASALASVPLAVTLTTTPAGLAAALASVAAQLVQATAATGQAAALVTVPIDATLTALAGTGTNVFADLTIGQTLSATPAAIAAALATVAAAQTNAASAAAAASATGSATLNLALGVLESAAAQALASAGLTVTLRQVENWAGAASLLLLVRRKRFNSHN